MVTRTVAVAVALLALVRPSLAWELTFQIEPKVEECFYHELATGERLELDFEVIRGGLLDIELRVLGPSDEVIMQKMTFFNNPEPKVNEAAGNVPIMAVQPGLHKVCFNNKMSRWTAKVVRFFLDDGSAKLKLDKATAVKGEDGKEVATLEHLGPMIDSIVHISDDLNRVEKLQKHLRTRERVHRDTQDSTNSRVMYLSGLESVVLISLSLGQAFMIRNWFQPEAMRRV